jgi:hypothetical protein
VEVDLHHELLTPSRLPLLRTFEGLLRERPVEEPGSLLTLVGAVLGSLGHAGLSRVDHWEVSPGGWLPLPEPTHASLIEPLAHLVRALGAPEWAELSRADRFSVRLSGAGDHRADVVVRRTHREREHTISLDLTGRWRSNDVRRLVSRMRRDLPVLRIQFWGASPP